MFHPTRFAPPRRLRGGAMGIFVTLLLALGLVVLGAVLLLEPEPTPPTPPADTPPLVQTDLPGRDASAFFPDPSAGSTDAPPPVEPVTGLPRLDAAAPYQPQESVIVVDISEYAGYAGLIVANGGMEPNPDSFFAKNYGFQVKLSLSEGENWSELNNGRYAASATTADALAVFGRQFEVVVPVQLAYSRGADMVVVDRGIASINQLKGKVLAASQFNESEFFIRYLAQEAGVPVKVLRDLDDRPGAGELGLVFYEDAFTACDGYAAELANLAPRLNGCVGWTPRTEEVVAGSQGRAKMLVSNRNLLIVADILVVNRGFALAHPNWVKGLTHGVLEGNRLLRDEPDRHLEPVAKGFGWDLDKAKAELARVHLSNLPENLAFFGGTIDAAGSFSGIYQSSVLAYGDLIKNPLDPERFLDTAHLTALANAGQYAQQKIAIAPIRTGTQAPLEGQALLSKDIRFFFEPNSALLDRAEPKNLEYLDAIKQFLQVSPGSVVLLRGHVDNARMEEFRRQGGEQMVRNMALKAMELSKQRAQAVRNALLERHTKLDPARLELVGRGWEEPQGNNGDLNRRVEVQWFTLE